MKLHACNSFSLFQKPAHLSSSYFMKSPRSRSSKCCEASSANLTGTGWKRTWARAKCCCEQARCDRSQLPEWDCPVQETKAGEQTQRAQCQSTGLSQFLCSKDLLGAADSFPWWLHFICVLTVTPLHHFVRAWLALLCTSERCANVAQTWPLTFRRSYSQIKKEAMNPALKLQTSHFSHSAMAVSRTEREGFMWVESDNVRRRWLCDCVLRPELSSGPSGTGELALLQAWTEGTTQLHFWGLPGVWFGGSSRCGLGSLLCHSSHLLFRKCIHCSLMLAAVLFQD
jgi:hypothetical protein